MIVISQLDGRYMRHSVLWQGLSHLAFGGNHAASLGGTQSMSLDLSPCLASLAACRIALQRPAGVAVLCFNLIARLCCLNPARYLAGVVGDRFIVWTEADQAARWLARPVTTGTCMCAVQSRVTMDLQSAVGPAHIEVKDDAPCPNSAPVSYYSIHQASHYASLRRFVSFSFLGVSSLFPDDQTELF